MLRNRKGQTVCHAGGVVGVLTDNDDSDGIKIGGEGTKNLTFFREYCFIRVGLMEEVSEVLKIGFLEFGLEKMMPTGMIWSGGHRMIIALGV